MKDNICRIIEENLYNFYFRIACLSGFDYDRDSEPGFIRNEPGKWPAFILGGIEQNDQGEFIEKITEGIRSGKYPPFWIIREPAEPEDLMDRLGRSGIKPVNRWTGMSLFRGDFMNGQVKDDQSCPPGLEIQKLNKKQDVPSWVSLLNKEVFRRDALTVEMVSLLLNDKAFNLYAGFKDGKLISSILSFIDDRVAGLYLFATAAECRRQGIGKAVISRAVKDSFLYGADKVILHGTRAGESLYLNLGFKVYCHFDILWYFS